MKKRIPTFLAGMLTTALIGSLGISALAATGQLTLTVDPVNIQVNGATFTPKDAQGNSVPVFSYNGTTYAPLRALAEAYGLEVGYDQGKNMATVGAKTADPATTPAPDTVPSDDYSTWSAEEEAAYQEFKGMWEVELIDKGDATWQMNGTYRDEPWEMYKLTYVGALSYQEISTLLNLESTQPFLRRLAYELRSSDVRIDIKSFYSDGAAFGFRSFS